ncbi:MAG: hypothetical protein ACKPBV_21160, partial [Sphaerospermopsis kisseleviana]
VSDRSDGQCSRDNGRDEQNLAGYPTGKDIARGEGFGVVFPGHKCWQCLYAGLARMPILPSKGPTSGVFLL